MEQQGVDSVELRRQLQRHLTILLKGIELARLELAPTPAGKPPDLLNENLARDLIELFEEYRLPTKDHKNSLLARSLNILYAEAEENYRRALAIQESLHGGMHAEVGRVLSGLGSVLADLGRYQEAESTLRRAASIQEKRAEEAPFELSGTLLSLSIVLMENDQPEEATSLMDRSSELMDQAFEEWIPVEQE